MDIKHDIVAYLYDVMQKCPQKRKYRAIMQNVVGSTLFDFKLYFIRIIMYKIFFDIGKDIDIGHNVKLQWRHRNKHNRERDLTIGDHVLIASDCRIDYSGGITINDQVKISNGALILTHTHMTDNGAYLRRNQPIRFTHLIIEKKAWLGERCVILPSVSRIGTGAIIGAGAVVGHDVPDNAIVSGNPARVIGYTKQW